MVATCSRIGPYTSKSGGRRNHPPNPVARSHNWCAILRHSMRPRSSAAANTRAAGGLQPRRVPPSQAPRLLFLQGSTPFEEEDQNGREEAASQETNSRTQLRRRCESIPFEPMDWNVGYLR